MSLSEPEAPIPLEEEILRAASKITDKLAEKNGVHRTWPCRAERLPWLDAAFYELLEAGIIEIGPNLNA